MAVKIVCVENGDTIEDLKFMAEDLNTGKEVATKVWYEKSKSKYHIVLGPNSANRKYISLNEFDKNNKEGEYVIEDKTTAPRVIGTSEPDKKLIPYMSDEDKARYTEIVDRAKEAMLAEKVANKKQPKTELEKLLEKKAKLEKQIAEAEAAAQNEEVNE